MISGAAPDNTTRPDEDVLELVWLAYRAVLSDGYVLGYHHERYDELAPLVRGALAARAVVARASGNDTCP